MDKITIRPSSIPALVSCPRQWYKVFIEGHYTIPNARALVGTGIHAGVEAMWREAMSTQKKDPNVRMMADAAIESFDNHVKDAETVSYDDGLDDDGCRLLIARGVKAFADDIVPFTPIPEAVETRVSIELNHPMVKGVSGTIDYIGGGTLADVKTSKRAVVASGHVLQQSTYKFLAENAGHTVNRNHIQCVVLAKTKTVGEIAELTANVDQVKYIINNLLDRLEAVFRGADPELMFPGNPKHYLCSDKYCNLRSSCPFVTGEKENRL